MTQEFEAAIDDWLAGVDADLHAIARQAIYKLVFNVVIDTPVDIGFLRGSWQPSFGAPAPPKPEVSLDPSGALALADLAVKIANLKLGDVFHYSNACVYARRLEYGFVGYDSLGRYYNQAGRFFVATNVSLWSNYVAQARAELKGGKV